MSSKNLLRDLQNDSRNIIDKYQIYFNRSIKATDEICRKIVSLNFKIINFDPLAIEIESYPSEEKLHKLITIFKNLDGKRHEENKKTVKLQKQDSNSSSNDPCTSDSWERVEDDLVSAFNSKVCLTDTDQAETKRKNLHFDVNKSNTKFDSLNSQLTDVNEHNLDKIFSQCEDDRNSPTLEQHGNALKFTKGFSEVKTRENNPHVTEKLFSESDKYQSSSNDIDNDTENDRNADASYHQETTDDKQLAFESHQQPDMNKNHNGEHKKNTIHDAAHKHNKKEQVSGNDPEKKLGLNKKAVISEQHAMPQSALGSQVNNKSTIKEASNQEKKIQPEIGLSEIGKKTLDDTVESFPSIKKKEHTEKDDSDSEIEEITTMFIKEKKFKAACIFYRETDYYSCLKSAVKMRGGYELKFSTKGKDNELQSLLKDFKVLKIDGKEKTEDIRAYVEKNIPSTRAFCFEGNILTLMGQKVDLLAAKSKILSLIESNDEDTTVKAHTLSENTWQEDKVKIMHRPENINEKESKTKKGEKKSNYIDLVSEKKGTEKEEMNSVIISIEKFNAAKHFYKGTSSLSNLSAVQVNANTVKVTAEKQGSKNLSILKDFETVKINAKKRAKDIERLVRKKFPETKTVCLEDNILFVMGQREDVEAVRRETSYLMDKFDDDENLGENICKSSTEKKLSSLENSGKATSHSQIKTSEKIGSDMQKSAENSPSGNSDVEMRSNNSDSEQEELISKTLTKKIFRASKIFYEDTKYFSYLQSGVKIDDDYELKLSYKDVKAQEFLKELEGFKIFEIDGKEKTKEIITYVQKNFPSTKAICFKGTILTFMGQKADLQAARSKILSMIGNNDEDTTWSANKVAENSNLEEMKNKQGVESFDNLENNQSKKSEDVFNRQANETGARAKEKKGDDNQYGFGRKDCKENKTENRHIEMSYQNTPVFIGCSKLKVIVLKKDITLERVDCIVSAATPTLKPKGGVGGAIARAAGLSMQQECDSYIKEQKYIPVTEIFVSGPGYLLGKKKIIHAVGPKWDDYTDKEKSKCDDDLRRTILRCLLTASKMKMSSIALPAVSSAGLKVPSDHCAYSYLNAVKHFDIITKELSLPPLQDIRFIDIKDEMVKTITDFFMNYWMKDTIDHLYQSDLDFARNYLKTDESKSTSKFETRNRAGSRSRIVSKQRQMSREYTKGNVKFGLSLKHAFDFRANLVVVIGKPFRKLSGLSSFYVSDLKVNNAKRNTKHVEFFNSQPFGKTTLNVCKLNIENETRKEIEKAFRNLKSVIEDKISVVITSKLLYPEENGGLKPDSQLLKTFCLLTYTSVMENLRDLTLLKYVTITASEEIMPTMIKCMDSELGFPGDDKKPSPQPERKFPSSPHSHYMSSNQSASMLGKKDEDGTSVDQSKCCKLCCNESTNLIILSCCNEKVCLSCNQKLLSCPYCRVTFGKITGTQPSGTMSVLQTKYDAAGYEYAGSWLITYKFPSGKQESYHPNPGQFYTGCERKAYLPDVSEGFEILQLLRLAFIRGLTFTIGKSLTTNRDNVITWNDIHHKSSLNGGNYGFPDPTYFKRVKEELRVKGVNLENMTAEEKRDLDNFTHQCRAYKYFGSTFTTV